MLDNGKMEMKKNTEIKYAKLRCPKARFDNVRGLLRGYVIPATPYRSINRAPLRKSIACLFLPLTAGRIVVVDTMELCRLFSDTILASRIRDIHRYHRYIYIYRGFIALSRVSRLYRACNVIPDLYQQHRSLATVWPYYEIYILISYSNIIR